MTMPIISYGEVLIDMLASGSGGKDSTTAESYTRYPGGAPANVAVAAARLGASSFLLGKLSRDAFGKFLLDSLKQYGVDTRFIRYSESGKTALAFVSLDSDGERSFCFYDDNAAHKDFSIGDLPVEAFQIPSIFNFSSGTLAVPGPREANLRAIALTRDSNGVVSMDINYRAAFWESQESAASCTREVAGGVDIIKTSGEELQLLFGEHGVDEICSEWLDSGVALVIVTNGGDPVVYRTRSISAQTAIPSTPVVDTTAAGDAFVGGLLYQLSMLCENRQDFRALCADQSKLAHIVSFATRCGAVTVSRFGAFTSLPESDDLL